MRENPYRDMKIRDMLRAKIAQEKEMQLLDLERALGGEDDTNDKRHEIILEMEDIELALAERVVSKRTK